MKLHILGVKRIKGISSKSGNDFDMCRIFAMVPISPMTGKTTVTGHGFELAEMELDPASMRQFSTLAFPVELELTTDSRPFMGKLETVVTGFVGAAANLKSA